MGGWLFLNLRKGCAHYECGGVRVDLIFICVINKFMRVVVKATSARRQQMGADGFFFWVFWWWYTHIHMYGGTALVSVCICMYALGAKRALNCLLCVYICTYNLLLFYGMARNNSSCEFCYDFIHTNEPHTYWTP